MGLIGRPGEVRSHNLQIKSLLHCQLCYWSIVLGHAGGYDPLAAGLKVPCPTNRLSMLGMNWCRATFISVAHVAFLLLYWLTSTVSIRGLPVISRVLYL